eukprot:11656082-Ditylum_brightwellii.AAC.1
MLAWGRWGWWSKHIFCQQEYNDVVEGIYDPLQHRQRRRDLVERWIQQGYTPQAEEDHLRRSRRQSCQNNHLRAKV